jgi:hypothetical protein
VKNLTTAIFGKLSGSTLATDIGGRLYKGRAPEGAEYPYAVYMLVSDVPEKTFTEQYENVIIQFSLFSSASGSTEVEDMYTHLSALYDECAMTITGSTLVWMKRSNAQLMVEDHTTPAGTAQVWHYAVDFEVLISLT